MYKSGGDSALTLAAIASVFASTLYLFLIPSNSSSSGSDKDDYDNSSEEDRYGDDPNDAYGSQRQSRGSNHGGDNKIVPVGLKNLGNTCYMNSILQGFASSPLICDFFYQSSLNEHAPFSKAVWSCLSQMTIESAKKLKEQNNYSFFGVKSLTISPSDLEKQLRSLGPQFENFGKQQDSDEYFVLLIDAIEKELIKANKIAEQEYINQQRNSKKIAAGNTESNNCEGPESEIHVNGQQENKQQQPRVPFLSSKTPPSLIDIAAMDDYSLSRSDFSSSSDGSLSSVSIVTPLSFTRTISSTAVQVAATNLSNNIKNKLHQQSQQQVDQPIRRPPKKTKTPFEGSLMSQNTCTKCGKSTLRSSTFSALPLSIVTENLGSTAIGVLKSSKHVCSTLEECLSAFTATETIDDVECTKCAPLITGKPAREKLRRRLMLGKMPKVLCLQLQRKMYDPRLQQMVKVDSHVQFPLFLNAHHFTFLALLSYEEQVKKGLLKFSSGFGSTRPHVSFNDSSNKFGSTTSLTSLEKAMHSPSFSPFVSATPLPPNMLSLTDQSKSNAPASPPMAPSSGSLTSLPMQQPIGRSISAITSSQNQGSGPNPPDLSLDDSQLGRSFSAPDSDSSYLNNSHSSLGEGRASNGNLWYALRAVIVHHGSHMGGHYTAYRRIDTDNSLPEGKWIYASDDHVRECSIKEVLGASAYILIYDQLMN